VEVCGEKAAVRRWAAKIYLLEFVYPLVGEAE